MSLGSPKPILSFEGVPDLGALEAVSGCPVRRLGSALEAAQVMTLRAPELLVVRGDVAWQREFVKRIAAEQRPPVLVLGGAPEGLEIADEWLAAPPTGPEAETRLRLAKLRARERCRMARRAFRDGLTGLPNRRAVIRALVREAARARRSGSELALVLIDLDDFKQVNERHGHAAGDSLLRRVGAALRSAAREGEACGRIGGDEFALVLSAGAQAADAAVRRIRRALLAAGISASAAAGVLQEDERLRALYRRVDGLLFAAKRRRRLVPRTPAGTPAAHVIAGTNQTPRRSTHVLGMQRV